jgi:hypothetical protein
MDRKAIIAAVVAAVVFGAAGFGGGVLLGRSMGSGGFANRAAFANRNGGGQNRGAASGKVTAKDATSFTVKMLDGSTRTVYYAASTKFSKVDSATASDVSVDTTITATGTSTSSGDVTADNVIIGSLGGFGFGGFGRMGGTRNTNSGTSNSGGSSSQGGGFGGPPVGFGD